MAPPSEPPFAASASCPRPSDLTGAWDYNWHQDPWGVRRSHWFFSCWTSCELSCEQVVEPESVGVRFGFEVNVCGLWPLVPVLWLVQTASLWLPLLNCCSCCHLAPDWLADMTHHQSWAGVLEYLATGCHHSRNTLHQALPSVLEGWRLSAGQRGMVWRRQGQQVSRLHLHRWVCFVTWGRCSVCFVTWGRCSGAGDAAGRPAGSAPAGWVWFCWCWRKRWCWNPWRMHGLSPGVGDWTDAVTHVIRWWILIGQLGSQVVSGVGRLPDPGCCRGPCSTRSNPVC